MPNLWASAGGMAQHNDRERRPGSVRRLFRVGFALAFVAAVASACSPGFFQLLLAKEGYLGGGHGAFDSKAAGGSDHRGGKAGGQDREAALRDEIIGHLWFGTAIYTRLGGRCPTNRFTTEFRFDTGGPNLTPRLVQVFAPGSERASALRSARLGMYSDDSRRIDNVHFLDLWGKAENRGDVDGLMVEAANRQIRGLRNEDTLADALRPGFVKDQLSIARGGERPIRLLQAIGAPNNACTMSVDLMPAPESPPFPVPRSRDSRLQPFFDALEGLSARGQAADGRIFDSVAPDFIDGVRLARAFVGADQVAEMNRSRNDLGLRDDFFFAATDDGGDSAVCGTGDRDLDATGAEIDWAYGLLGEDGRTTIVGGLVGDPSVHFDDDYSWALRAGAYYQGLGLDSKFIETHEKIERRGSVGDDGEVIPGSGDDIVIGMKAVSFPMPPRGVPPDVILLEGFNTDTEGQPTVCDSLVVVPIPSTLPPIPAPEDDAIPPCEPTPTALCLNRWIQVEVDFPAGAAPGSLVEDDPTSGVWFLGDAQSEEPEQVLVRVVNGCDVNGHIWAQHAGTGNTPHSVTFTDRRSGESDGSGRTFSFDTWSTGAQPESGPTQLPSGSGFARWDIETPAGCQF